MSVSFDLSAVNGYIGQMHRVRLSHPNGSPTWEYAMVEGTGEDVGEFTVPTTVMSPTPEDSDEAYTYEVRRVDAQTTEAFDASEDVVVYPSTVYGYLVGQLWVDAPGAAEVEEPFDYHTVQDVYNEGGQDNVLAYARTSGNEGNEEVLRRIRNAMLWSEAFIDDWMREAGRVTPLVLADESNSADPTLVLNPLLSATAAKLTIVKLYSTRGQNDVQDPNDDEAVMTRSMIRSKEREACAQLSFWARPTDTLLKRATGVATGGGVGVV